MECTKGIYNSRSFFISTETKGEVIGSGDIEKHGLTLQIDGAGIEDKHFKLFFDGDKGFTVIDYGSVTGTWMSVVG